MDVFEAIKSRRSVRSVRRYKSKQVDKELIIKLLEAARWAPSGGNIQPWLFIVIDDLRVLDVDVKYPLDILVMLPS